MIVKVKTASEALRAERDYRDFLTITVDSVERLSVHDGEPEDATLGRNFNDAYKISELMQEAYDAGARGEGMSVEHVEVGVGEDW